MVEPTPRARHPFRSVFREDECADCLERQAPCSCEWQCNGCSLCFQLDGDEPRNVVDGETYCAACALELELWLLEEQVA